MNTSKKITLAYILVALCTWSGKVGYVPPTSGKTVNYLVVDAVLNSGSQTTINLSRTRSLVDSVNNIPELNAQVTVEGNGSDIFPIYGQGNGQYIADYLYLNPSEQYRLHIITQDGTEYISDYVEVKQTPPIDSVFWEKQGDGLHVYVNTHDPTGNSKYYQWNYAETWQYTSSFFSYLEYIDNGLVIRPNQNFIYNCWHNVSSSSILIGNTSGLSEDILSRYQLVFIPNGSEKPWIRYSINVNQHALTKDAYQYWETLRKSTEELGSLFDPQPSQLPGNIHCTTRPDEPVIGYVSAATISTQRIFIEYDQIKPWVLTNLTNCQIELVPLDKINEALGDTLTTTAIDYHYTNGILTGVDASTIDCVDCRIKGGTNVKPAFWP